MNLRIHRFLQAESCMHAVVYWHSRVYPNFPRFCQVFMFLKICLLVWVFPEQLIFVISLWFCNKFPVSNSPLLWKVLVLFLFCGKCHHLCLRTRDFFRRILAVLVFQSRNIGFNVCDKLDLCDLLTLCQNCSLWPFAFLFFEICWVMILKVVFLDHCHQALFAAFWSLRASWNTYFVEFSSILSW